MTRVAAVRHGDPEDQADCRRPVVDDTILLIE